VHQSSPRPRHHGAQCDKRPVTGKFLWFVDPIRRFVVRNLGGRGRFRLLLEDDYPVPKAAQSHFRVMRLPPFKVNRVCVCLCVCACVRACVRACVVTDAH
jgi:hypothetical protein